VAGAIVVVVAMVVVLPPLLFGSGALVAALLGWLLRDDAEARHEGSELIDLNT
jgi:hypothetical protein